MSNTVTMPGNARIVIAPLHDAHHAIPFAVAHDDLTIKTRERLAQSAQKTWHSSILSWWPVVVGFVLAAYAPELRLILSSLGEWGIRFFMPMVAMAYQFEGTSLRSLSHDLPQIALTVQFPLEGIFVRRTLRRGASLRLVIVLMLMLHLVSTILLWLLLHPR
jgi:hypothetical protein